MTIIPCFVRAHKFEYKILIHIFVSQQYFLLIYVCAHTSLVMKDNEVKVREYTYY